MTSSANSNFEDFSIPHGSPVLPPPSTGTGRGINPSALSVENTPNHEEQALKGACCLSAAACLLCKDSKLMLVLLELFGVAAKTCSYLGQRGAEVIPYLSLFAAPTYLYHAAS